MNCKCWGKHDNNSNDDNNNNNRMTIITVRRHAAERGPDRDRPDPDRTDANTQSNSILSTSSSKQLILKFSEAESKKRVVLVPLLRYSQLLVGDHPRLKTVDFEVFSSRKQERTGFEKRLWNWFLPGLCLCYSSRLGSIASLLSAPGTSRKSQAATKASSSSPRRSPAQPAPSAVCVPSPPPGQVEGPRIAKSREFATFGGCGWQLWSGGCTGFWFLTHLLPGAMVNFMCVQNTGRRFPQPPNS